ncbi:MAG: nucleoside triphosphate pyrophosphohydrolase [Fidelibacterota bacterium]|nr:MAG: nucleoside triphosphate pyrophosphohydrolase [Candidatus Neomarinimicrobiota bacterium]
MKPDDLALTPTPEVGERLSQLLAVIERLRSPEGCPWDREQTSHSLIPYLLEETYELIESIEGEDHQALKEELGDLLLHVLFQGVIAETEGWFTLEECISGLTAKLIDRHPHVFGDAKAEGAFHAKQNWEAAKQREKERSSRMDGVPRSLPALTRARRIQEKASHVGFDWNHMEPVWDKVQEELDELRNAHLAQDNDAIEEELGDILFSLVNLGRFLGINAEGALRRTIAKFEYRFRHIERELREQGKAPEEATLEEMDEIWNRYREKNLPEREMPASGSGPSVEEIQ